MNFDKTIALINKTEGRDKFCKQIQYACRFLKWALKGSSKETLQRIETLMTNMSNARKLFRLFKTANEYHKILALLQKGSEDDFDLYLNIVNRIFFGLYWIFDNLVVLSTIKFIQRDKAKLAKNAAWCWFLGLVTGLILYVRNLINEQKKAIALKKAAEDVAKEAQVKSEEPEKKEEIEKKKKELETKKQAHKKKKVEIWLNIAKTLGDMITASQGAGIPKRLTGLEFGDGAIGFGGFLSATITNYQMY